MLEGIFQHAHPFTRLGGCFGVRCPSLLYCWKRAGRKGCAMSDEPQRPTIDDRDAWKAYWQAQGMLWRTEPEIEEERQAYLTERRVVEPDIERGTYPFRDENGGIKLTRADVEWLL